MKQIIFLIVLILVGCSKVPETCTNTVTNNTFYYNTTIIKMVEIEKECPETEYTKDYVDGLIQEAKKCEKNFTYLDLEDCEDDVDRLDERWDKCRDDLDNCEDELDDCEDELCDLNSSGC